MKIAVFASNHYQFLTAVNLKLTLFREDTVHLFTSIWPPFFEGPPFEQAYRLFDKEADTTYSKELNEIADLCFLGADSYPDLTRGYFHTEPALLPAELDYEQVLTHGFSYFAHWVYARCYKNNASARLARFGDGTIFTFYPLNYFYHLDLRAVWARKEFRAALETLPWFIGATTQYLYRPEFAPDRAHPMIRIPAIEPGGPVSRLMNRFFGLADDYRLFRSHRYIFFDSGGTGEIKCLANEKELLAGICGRVGKENVLVRQHPRSPEGFYGDMGVTVDRSTSCIEYVYMNCAVHRKILIGALTTALYTPFELFNAHPEHAIILDPMAVYNPLFPRKHSHDAVSFRAQEQLVEAYCGRFPDHYTLARSWDDVDSAIGDGDRYA